MKKSHVVVKRGGGFRRDSDINTNSNSSSMVAGNVFYKECQKNHAANIGGYAVDGCREFMASSGSNNQDGASGVLACAACGCHRNFHRREVESEVACEHDDTGDSGGGH